jgi:glucosamine--fructose-6-phosphate aminotransferase (isomerizing)
MCGIVGYIGAKPVVPLILDGLKRLEYRGYDSAGIAVIDECGKLDIRRATGKLRNLEEAVRVAPLHGVYGIGHTRWATHGRPTEENAHPHRDCRSEIVVVHNGIVENYLELKHELIAEGHHFVTETDTEVMAHLIERYSADAPLEEAVLRTVHQISGVFALAAISVRDPGKIVAARFGPPVIVGLGNNESFVVSDLTALLQHTHEVIFLADGDVAVLTADGVRLMDFEGRAVSRAPQHVSWDPRLAEKGGYKHFMQKEIFEQPHAVRDTLLGRFSLESGQVFLDPLGISDAEIASLRGVKIIACGTSWHAALAGKFMIERLARIPVEVDYGSEFRYRDPITDDGSLVVVISQSGETADTLAALREAKHKGARTLAICNVPGSMITREAGGALLTHAGPEIGVASTKAFTCQLTVLVLLALHLARARGTIADDASRALLQELTRIPQKMEIVLQRNAECEELARRFFRHTDFLYLGRGIHYPMALEGALKLKEISYIHAEGYPAGEMKHGPNALIDENLPVVVIATRDESDPAAMTRYEKTISNIEEVRSRDGIVLSIVTEGDRNARHASQDVLEIPPAPELLAPLLEILPLQLLAYHIAVRRGCDVDQPRNLAKSVTVE